MDKPTLSVHEAIFTARSMRHFKPNSVSQEQLEYIIEAATMAPSAGNGQMWSFVVVADPEQRRRIAEAYREVGRAYIRDSILADPNIPADRERVYTKAMHNVEHLDEAPVIIIPCLPMRAPDDADIASGAFSTIYPACQNIILAARALGLGTVLITLATDYSPIKPQEADSLNKILDLPDGVTTAAIIPVGYPKGNWDRPWRKPWQETIHWDRWTSS